MPLQGRRRSPLLPVLRRYSGNHCIEMSRAFYFCFRGVVDGMHIPMIVSRPRVESRRAWAEKDVGDRTWRLQKLSGAWTVKPEGRVINTVSARMGHGIITADCDKG